KREVFDDELIGAKAGREQSDDVEGDLGMPPQQIAHITLRHNHNRTVRDRDGIRRKRVVREDRKVGKCSPRSEDLQYLLTAFYRRDRCSYAPAQHDEKSFAAFVLAEDDSARSIVALPQACHELPGFTRW